MTKSSFGKIYSYPNNPRIKRALIAAKYNGLEIETPAFDFFGKDNRTAAYLAKFPQGKVSLIGLSFRTPIVHVVYFCTNCFPQVPGFEGADGFCVTESYRDWPLR